MAMKLSQRLLMTGQEVARRGRSCGVLPNRADYVPYLIVGRSRTGSTLLLRSLKEHPAVVGYGELLRDDRINWQSQLGFPTPKQREQYAADPCLFLRERVFGPYGRQVQAVGFKLFYYHAQQPTWRGVWDYLTALPNLHVVHVKRRNLLAIHFSRKVADQTGRWNGKVAGAPAQGALALDPAECIQDFEETRAWEVACDQRFAGHPLHQVSYEDLAADFAGELAKVQRFLGVEVQPMQPVTAKQERQPLAQRIANYGELKAQFTGTPWAGFFE